jgi:hypothetical protein
MFRLMKLKPPHGWNAVAWELGIVTLGVVIALAAQQVVEGIHWRSEMRDFRTAVKAEISDNLATYPYRNGTNRCLVGRLDELQRWLDSWRAGRPLRLTAPIGMPTSLVVRTTVWDSRDPETVSRMPLTEKLEYGSLYTEFANAEVHRLDERAAWVGLGDYDGATELDHQDLMRLQGLITRARLRLRRIDTNSVRFIKRATTLGIRPVPNPEWPPPDTDICSPILPRNGGAAA